MANEFIARNGIVSKSNLVVSGSLTALSTITAQTLVVQTITSSISSITGSTNFGTLSSNTHTFTGSLNATGSSHSILGDVGIGVSSPSNNFQVQNDEGYLTLLYKASGSDTIISSNYHTYDGFDIRYGYETNISSYEYNNIFYQPASGYFGRSGSSTYFMKFESGYPSASLQRTVFQLNGNDKLTLLESGEVVIGKEGYSNISQTSIFPAIIRGAQPASSYSNVSGSSLTIQGGRGRGTGPGGDILFKTSNAGNESSSTLNTALTRMVIKGQGGNVGIADNNPQQKLSVGGTGQFSGGVLVGSGYRVEFVDQGSTSYSWIEGSSYDRAYSFLSFNTSGSEKMRLTSAGNLGIGTLTPSHSLHISLNSNTGSSVNHLFLFNPTSGTSQTAGVRLGTSGGWTVQLRTVENQDWLQIADSGGTVRHGWYSNKYYPGASSLNNSGTGYISGDGTNIGIGTTSPSYKLDVSGTVNFVTAKTKFVGGTNYNENIRMSVQSSGYSSIAMGADLNSDAGAIAGQWTLVRWPDANSNKFSIRHDADDRLLISTAGHITTPAQPAFYAYLPGGANTSTTGNYAGFTSTRLNRGSHYNTSTGRFTAPITGVYRFLFVALYRQQSGTGPAELSISINGSNLNSRGMTYANVAVTNAHIPCTVELIYTLNAGDYVMPFIYSVGSGSDWYVGENLAYFCGYLLG